MLKLQKESMVWKHPVSVTLPDDSKRRDRSIRSIAAVLGLIALCGYWCVLAVHRLKDDTGDFGHFYHAARAMLDGKDIYSSWHHGYIYPPFLAFLFTPLALLAENTAAYVAFAINLGMLILAAAIAARELIERFGERADLSAVCGVVLIGVLLTADKLRHELLMWQTNLPMLLLLVLALRWLDRRPVLAGAALAAAFDIKYLPIVLLPYLLLRRRWRAAVAFLALIPVFALSPAILIGWDVNCSYLAMAYRGLFHLFGISIDPASAANIEDIRNTLSVSATSGIARALGPKVATSVTMVTASIVALIALYIVQRFYRRNGIVLGYRPDGLAPQQPLARAATALEWSALITTVLIFSPQTNSRHFSLLLLPSMMAAVLLTQPRRMASRGLMLTGVLLLLFGLIFPTAELPLEALTQSWREVSGMAWCVLGFLGILMWVGLRTARLRDESCPADVRHAIAA
jgi:Glycosyltransferase family 87